MRKSVLLLPLLMLGACSTVEEAVMGPQLSDMGYPAALVPLEQPIGRQSEAASAGSLWRAGSRTFFRDQRARDVGDILTVEIQIDDRANVQNSTTRDRSNETQSGIGAFFGLENALGQAFPAGFDPSNLVELEGGSSSSGSGVIQRSEPASSTPMRSEARGARDSARSRSLVRS